MIDVVFLLLTFFIYTLVVRVEFLPVQLMGVSTGEQLTERDVVAITIDRAGRYYVNREPLGEQAFEDRLREIGGLEDQPMVVVAMQVEDVDQPWLFEAEAGVEADAVEGAEMIAEMVEDAAADVDEVDDVPPLERSGTLPRAVDRGPVIVHLIGLLQQAGIKDFRFAGPPASGAGGGMPAMPRRAGSDVGGGGP